MANLNTQKIEVLFRLCLVKSGKKRMRSEYDDLAEVINNSNPSGIPNITQKYLDEGIDKRLLSALEENRSNVGINPAYMDVLALYLGYEDFRAYEAAYDVAYQQLNRWSSNQIQFFHPKYQKVKATEVLASLYYPEQQHSLNIEYSILPKAPQLINGGKESLFTVLFIDQEWIKDNSLDLEIKTHDTALLIASRNEEGQTILQPLTQLEFALYFQLLLLGENQESASAVDQNNSPNLSKRPIIIKDSGAINLGTIKAKYISGNDMTINIEKKK